MREELVANGIRAGKSGATSTSGAATGAGAAAGAGADFFFLVALFFFLLDAAAARPMQQHNKAMRSAQATIGMKDPEKPESTEPELAWKPDESPEVSESNEPEVKEFKDAEESPLDPDEESHAVTVVVGAAVGTTAATASFALATGAGGATGSGVV